MMTNPAVPIDTAIDHARAVAACGLRVLPIIPGQKYPPMKSWPSAASTEERTIAAWWNGLYRNHGVGIAMGDQPDGRHIFAVDIDNHKDGVNGYDTVLDLERIHGQLPDTVASLTGSGGQHRLYLAPPGIIVHNQQNNGNRIGPGVDVRGAGGQIVVAPTVHPDSGRLYTWEPGYAPWEHPIAPAPDWLLNLVTEPPAPTPSVAVIGITINDLIANDVDSIAEQVREWWDWDHELTARGWQQGHQNQTYWTRPGKDPRKGHSAVLHPGGPFVVFTSDVPEAWKIAGIPNRDNSGWSFSPFGFVAAVDHNGDRSAAARTLRRAMSPSKASSISAEHDAEEDDWARHNLAEIVADILAGTRQPELPTYLEVADTLPLLYRGRVHSIFGPPGGGKTWVALRAVAERLQADEHVLFIDWEDSPDGTAQRLAQLGCTPQQVTRLDYRNPATSLAFGYSALIAGADPWTLVVIDSAGEAMAAQGVDPNADGDVAVWMSIAKSLTRQPSHPAVLMLDHIPKANDTPASFAIGSQRKLAAITGAAYRCDTVIEPAKGKPGKLKLVVAKDRLGNRAKASIAAEIHLVDDDTELVITLTISEAQAAHERGERFRPTHLMERVSRWLELHPDSTKRAIREDVDGSRTGVDMAIEILIEDGCVIVTREGQAHIHRVVNPYREPSILDSDPVDNPTVATVANRGETVARHTSDTTCGDRGGCGGGGLLKPRQTATVTGVGQPKTNPTVAPVENPDPLEDF